MNGILLNQGGAGAVESVNGQTGEVNLTATDINSYTIEEINELLNNKAESIQEIKETELNDLRLNNNNPVLFKITGTEEMFIDPSFSPYFVYALEEQPLMDGATTKLFQYKILQDGIYHRTGKREPALPGLPIGNVWEDWEDISKISSVNGQTGEINLTFNDLQTSQNLIITDSDTLTRITLYDPENRDGNHSEYIYPYVEVRHDDVAVYNRGQTDFLSAKLDRQDFIDFQDDFIPALNEQINSIMERLEALEALHPQESE